MIDQEVFETSAKHLLTQRQRAATPGGTCQLRTYDGLKCAIGALIPEDKYHSEMERTGFVKLLKELGYEDLNLDLIFMMVDIHDLLPVYEWKSRLIETGNLYNLDTEFLNDFTN